MTPKSILKKDKKSLKKSIIWDENAIAEHNLERGGRMKIDEPKTPFIHYSIDSDTVLGSSIDPPPMVLVEAVDKIQIKASDSVDWSSGDEIDHSNVIGNNDVLKQKQMEFDRKRKLHYNMKTALSHKD